MPKLPPALRVFVLLRRLERQASLLAEALSSGLWLGLLSPEQLQQASDHFYCSGRYQNYPSQAYNQLGLWSWEERALQRHFQGRSRLLIAGIGGGREVLALQQRGYQVDGFECNPELLHSAQQLMAAQPSANAEPPILKAAPANQCPDFSQNAPYDGLIVGWATYMHIPGRQRRIAFLRSMAQYACPDAPILLSFMVRGSGQRSDRLRQQLANGLRRLRRQERVELGDGLLETLHLHRFIKEEVVEELEQAGFRFVAYHSAEYGHAIGQRQAS